jgi:hypothetical protein
MPILEYLLLVRMASGTKWVSPTEGRCEVFGVLKR